MKLTKLRTSHGISEQELANYLQHQNTDLIKGWETGKPIPAKYLNPLISLFLLLDTGLTLTQVQERRQALAQELAPSLEYTKALRTKYGVRQIDIARFLGLSSAVPVNRWDRGVSQPSPENQQLLSLLFRAIAQGMDQRTLLSMGRDGVKMLKIK